MGEVRHVLVTGGAGFIGSHLVEALLAGGARVTALDDLSTGSRDNLAPVAAHPRFTFVLGDATQALAGQLGEAGSPTHVAHLAAQVSVTASFSDPRRDLEQNLVATLRVLELARACRARVVLASSAAVYGDGPLPSDEAHAVWPLSPYGIHKLASEQHLRVAAAVDRLGAVSLRFFNVYGPRQLPTSPYAGVISVFIQRALAAEPLLLFGAGAATRDFVFVSDLVRAIALALDGDAAGAFNVGTGTTISVRQLAEAVVAVTGSRSPLIDAPARAGEVLHSRAAVGRIEAALGWRATTELAQGLAETAAWIERIGRMGQGAGG